MDLPSSKRTKVRVCVVGCGVSGAGAAADLVEAGVTDVLVVEAMARPGGRVHTIPFGGGKLELGAQWIHGEEGNCVYEWARDTCPANIDTEMDLTQTGMGETIFVDPHGVSLPGEVTERFQDEMLLLDKADKSDFEGSLGECYEQSFSSINKWGMAGWQMLEWHGRFQSIIDGSDSWHSVSVRTRAEYWECPGNPTVNWVDSGYQTFMDHLVSKVGSERILLNSPVSSISWASDRCGSCGGLEDLSKDMEQGLVLTSPQPTVNGDITDPGDRNCSHCGDGRSRQACIVTLPDRIIEADHVIFSGSVGVLKGTANHLFQPPLPTNKLTVIEGLGFDTVAKVYLQFEERWWHEDCNGYSFINDLSGTPPDPVENWEEHLLGFYTVRQQPLVLCGWVSGTAARAMERTPLADVISRCHQLLCRRLAAMRPVTKPVWGTRSMWGSNPYTRGSYSYRSLRSDQGNVWASDLAQPVTVAGGCPVLCFCGEATHQHYYSTVHGAWETGKREARRLLDYWNEATLQSASASSKQAADDVTTTREPLIPAAGANSGGLCCPPFPAQPAPHSICDVTAGGVVFQASVCVVGCSVACLTALQQLGGVQGCMLVLQCPGQLEAAALCHGIRVGAAPLLRCGGPVSCSMVAEALLVYRQLQHSLPLPWVETTAALLNSTVEESCSSMEQREVFWMLCGRAMKRVWGHCEDPPRQLLLYYALRAKTTLLLGSGSVLRGLAVDSVSPLLVSPYSGRPVLALALIPATAPTRQRRKGGFSGHNDDTKEMQESAAPRLLLGESVLVDEDSSLSLLLPPQQVPEALSRLQPESVATNSAEASQLARRLADHINCVSRPLQQRPTSRHTVVVVGAGAAALGALLTLNSQGITDVLLLEGSGRVGGRVHSVYPGLQPHSPVELGAQWVHGKVGNVLYEAIMQRQPDLISSEYSVDGGGVFYSSGGGLVPEGLVSAVAEYCEEGEQRLEGRQLNEPAAGSSSCDASSVASFFLDPRRWQQFVRSRTQEDSDLCQAVFDWNMKWYLADNACDGLESLSAPQWSRYRYCDGEFNINPSRGMSALINRLYQDTTATITLNSVVNRIEYCSSVAVRGGRFCSSSDADTPPVTLTCNDGRLVGAETVIVTPSIGYLKAHPDLFSPPLPPLIHKAINSMGFGTLNKVVLEYSERWWEPLHGSQSMQLVWLPQPRPNINSDRWDEYVLGFDATHGRSPRLTAWVAGVGAAAVERCSEGEVGRRCTDLLRRFLNRENIPHPISVFRSQWRSNPMTLGTYSHPSVEFERNGCTVEHLNTPVTAECDRGSATLQVPMVVLAGEANNFHYFSTVHGALQNGMEQAKLVVKARKNLVSTPASKL